MEYQKMKKLFDEFVRTNYHPFIDPINNKDIVSYYKLYGRNFKTYIQYRNLFNSRIKLDEEAEKFLRENPYIHNWKDVDFDDEDPYNKLKKKEVSDKKVQVNDKEKKKKSKNESEKKIYKCMLDNCNRQYTSAFGLKYHMKEGHSKEKLSVHKPFVCKVDGCGRKYKNNNGLKYHLRTIHHIE
ncbi:hypothetical protein P3W45_000001 [Vairimorpha bombi]|jgi:hypothetical protein